MTGTILGSYEEGDMTTAVVSFNKDNQGWNYAWHSHRQKRDLEHHFRIFVLCTHTQAAGTNKNNSIDIDATPKSRPGLSCVAAVKSPGFSIYCRRKRSRTLAADGHLPSNSENHPQLRNTQRAVAANAYEEQFQRMTG